LRWQIDLHKQQKAWSDVLYNSFVNRECDVIHLVFFVDHAFRSSDDREQLRQKIKEVKSVLDDLRDETCHTIRCKDVWFGEYHVAAANDSRTNGRIKNAESRQFPYLPFLRFANTKSLWVVGFDCLLFKLNAMQPLPQQLAELRQPLPPPAPDGSTGKQRQKILF
ncbi:MAG: hypothetical protein ACKN89_15760, partial [Cyanobium sp.]